MTKRYYYTDALAAAWMAKHFGMVIYTHQLDNGVCPKRWRDFNESLDSLARDVIDGCEDRYYIHAESLQLLEPQDGDGVEFDRWYWERTRKEPGFEDAPIATHYGSVRRMKATNKDGGVWMQISSAGIGWDDNYSGGFSLPFKIIRRNGLAFHWPESEEA